MLLSLKDLNQQENVDSLEAMSERKAKDPKVNIGIPPQVHTRLVEFCGTSRILRDVAGKVLEWFVAQPPSVQRVLLGEYETDVSDAYARVLEGLAAKLRGGIVTGEPGQSANGKPAGPQKPGHHPAQKPAPKH